MWRNKHLIIALLVSPVLAVLAWFAVGQLLGDQRHAAVQDAVYPLLEKSNCRYPSGRCELANGDFSLELELERAPGLHLALRSSLPLQGVLLAVVPAGLPDNEAGPPPEALRSADATGTQWRLPLDGVPPAGARLRLVAATEHNRFTGDAATRFLREREMPVPAQR